MTPTSLLASATSGPQLLWLQFLSWLPQLVSGLVTLLIFYGVHRLLGRGLTLLLRRSKIDPTAGAFLQNLVTYSLVAVALVTALGQLGVDVSGLLASLGVAGLTIGFAARDALSNVISGLFIFWDRPFVLGDLVEIGDTYGKVQEITMRSTRVVTPDGRMLAIPNTAIVNSTVASYTNFPHLRLDVDIDVGTGEDLGRVRRLLLELVEGESQYMSTPAASVVITRLGDYSIGVQLRVWVEDEKSHIQARFALRERMFEALRAAGVDMPAETFNVHSMRPAPVAAR
jgi:small conductance mechanosensitive channel